jgi:hypothetical protein
MICLVRHGMQRFRSDCTALPRFGRAATIGDVTTAAYADLARRGERRIGSTSPFYTRDADGRFQGVGTGLFLLHGGYTFVVTASHVLRDYMKREELWIGGHTGAIPVNQPHFVSKDEDAYDLGFIPLTDEQRDIFRDVTFVTAANIDREEDGGKQQYYAVGYRADDNEHEDDQTTLNARWSLYAAQSSSVQTYSERQVSRDLRLLLTFNRRILFGPDGPVETEPEPEGMSGSGVWRRTANPDTDVLTAIVDSHTDAGNLIYASRLGFVIEALNDYVTDRRRET